MNLGASLHDGARTNHQPSSGDALVDRTEERRPAFDYGTRIANDHQELLGSRHCHVNALPVVQKANSSGFVTPDQRQYYHVALLTFERVNRFDVVPGNQ